MVRFKKFRIQDILKWQPQKEIDPLKIASLTVKSDKKYPFYGQSTVNNGIISYNSLKEEVLNNKEGRPTILIHSNNQNIVYLETPFYLKDGHGATSVLQADFLNEKIALYIIVCIKKVITKKFSYNEKATKIALKNTEIDLPITENDIIDFNYMETYISNTERATIRKLENYLKEINLENYNLNNSEKKAIEKIKNNKLIYSDFKIEDLFISQNGDFDIQQKHINNKGHFVVSSGEQNNGIIGKTDIAAKIMNKNTITIDMFGYTYFRDFEYKMVTHARVFSLEFKLKKLNVQEGLYIMSQFKHFKNIFSYSNMASWNKIKDMKISLPVTSNKEIDYEYMVNFIKAQEKLLIKDVIIYKDDIINSN